MCVILVPKIFSIIISKVNAPRKHSCLPPSSPGLESQLRQDFFSLLLILRAVLRSKPSSAKQWILQMQLAVTSRAKYYTKTQK